MLEIAQRWLAVDEFETLVGRLIAGAVHEPELSQKAMKMASLLKVAAEEDRRSLSVALVEMLLEPGSRDELWVQVMSRMIEAEEFQWLIENLLPIIEDMQYHYPTSCVRLLCELAMLIGPVNGIQMLQAANQILPLEHWQRTTLLVVVPLLDRDNQLVLLGTVLHGLSSGGAGTATQRDREPVPPHCRCGWSCGSHEVLGRNLGCDDHVAIDQGLRSTREHLTFR